MCTASFAACSLAVDLDGLSGGAPATSEGGVADGGVDGSSGDGAPGSQPQVLASGQKNPISLVTDGARVWWASYDPDGSVSSIEVGGGAMRIDAPHEKGPFVLALASDAVYWAARGDNSVRAVARAGARQ